MFIDRFERMAELSGVTGYSICKALKIPDNYPTVWRDSCERNPDYTPNAKTLKKLSEYFHVSVDYLLGLEDEYGLNSKDWYNIASLIESWLSAIHRDFKWLFNKLEMPDVNPDDFANGKHPLSAEQLESIGEVCHIPDIRRFLPVVYASMLWPEMQKTATEVGDGLSDAQRYFLKELGDITTEEAVAAVAYIHGLRAKQ